MPLPSQPEAMAGGLPHSLPSEAFAGLWLFCPQDTSVYIQFLLGSGQIWLLR